ncbi:MAG: hypothetical protein MUE85_05205 [Microscillaceae bacterium]|jgi:hypothetical protein|nr:hypothetical protein [Microscillaceae bacterium]
MNTATATQPKKNHLEEESFNVLVFSNSLDKKDMSFLISKTTATTTKLVASENLTNVEVDELDLLNVSVNPIPTCQFKIKAKVKSITKGELNVFPDELDFDSI